jgi:hypothetical protein
MTSWAKEDDLPAPGTLHSQPHAATLQASSWWLCLWSRFKLLVDIPATLLTVWTLKLDRELCSPLQVGNSAVLPINGFHANRLPYVSPHNMKQMRSAMYA